VNVNCRWELPSQKSIECNDSDDSDSCEEQQEISEDDELHFVKIKIEIEDQGVGIAKENLPKLFMDFSKLDENSKMNTQGTGLGLSICKKIIEKLGGTVEVDSNLGKGTTFTVDMAMKAKKLTKVEKIGDMNGLPASQL
jgi:signal transduction histidine kinase